MTYKTTKKHLEGTQEIFARLPDGLVQNCLTLSQWFLHKIGPPSSNQGLFTAKPRYDHATYTVLVHQPTSSCPRLSAKQNLSPERIAIYMCHCMVGKGLTVCMLSSSPSFFVGVFKFDSRRESVIDVQMQLWHNGKHKQMIAQQNLHSTKVAV